MSGSLSLDTVPQEVLEHIAYFAATERFLGPPSSLIALLLTNRHINSILSITANHHLYARIFAYKFDTEAPIARLGANKLTASALAEELRRRCVVLQRIRARTDSTTHARHAEAQTEVVGDDRLTLYDVLTTTYFMLLENDGRNKQQLLEYANIKVWIREFWFDAHGSSLALYNLRTGHWPIQRPEASLGMWIFWFVLNLGDYLPNAASATEEPLNVLKTMALGAHLYSLTTTPWTQFHPSDSKTLQASLYSHQVNVNPPPLAAPAILSYLALLNRKRSILHPPSDASCQASTEWDSEWNRCLGKSEGHCFRPGSVEGIWEGFFTYTEFTGYAMLLGGAPPAIIQRSALGRHQHTWKLREHHLLGAEASDSDSGVGLENDEAPLRAGDPLRSYFPTGAQLTEHRDGVTVHDTQTGRVYQYVRPSPSHSDRPILDIIITGEGHSAWGQFNLVGRVRPSDGFISLSKDYVDGDRGKWLYRGYLVGDASGNISGRWRDTLSPVDGAGYEGCFVMSRRR